MIIDNKTKAALKIYFWKAIESLLGLSFYIKICTNITSYLMVSWTLHCFHNSVCALPHGIFSQKPLNIQILPVLWCPVQTLFPQWSVFWFLLVNFKSPWLTLLCCIYHSVLATAPLCACRYPTPLPFVKDKNCTADFLFFVPHTPPFQHGAPDIPFPLQWSSRTFLLISSFHTFKDLLFP